MLVFYFEYGRIRSLNGEMAVGGIGKIIVRPTVFATAAGFRIMGGTVALSNETNCRRLEDLAWQYTGVALTSQQQVAWYDANCHRMRSASARW